MERTSLSDHLLRRINALERWLEQCRTQYHLLPVRLAGYGLLVGLLMLSNVVALCRWPLAALRSRASRDGKRDDRGGHPIAADSEALQELVASGKPVLVDFWAAWCGPCIMMNEPLRRFARDAGATCLVAKVDTMKHADLAKKHGVKGLPTLILFEKGEEAGRHAGALSYVELKQWVDEHASRPASEPVRGA